MNLYFTFSIYFFVLCFCMITVHTNNITTVCLLSNKVVPSFFPSSYIFVHMDLNNQPYLKKEPTVLQLQQHNVWHQNLHKREKKKSYNAPSQCGRQSYSCWQHGTYWLSTNFSSGLSRWNWSPMWLQSVKISRDRQFMKESKYDTSLWWVCVCWKLERWERFTVLTPQPCV